MTKFEDLLAVAYKKERAASRRLARDTGMSEQLALQQTLAKNSAPRTLDDLVSARKLALLKLSASVTARKLAQTSKLAQKKAPPLPDPHAWLAWFDGATSPNPGKMGVGGLLKSPQGGTVEISFAAGHGDSNEAEYLALIAVLEAAVRLQPEQLIVYGDSQVVINDVNNAGQPGYVGAVNLQAYHARVQNLRSQLSALTLIWLPRAKNAAADRLSQRALHCTEIDG